MKSNRIRIKIILFISLVIVIGFFYFGTELKEYTTIDFIKFSKTILILKYEKNPSIFLFIYFALYTFFVSFSIPGATFLTIAAGAIFGFVEGAIVVSFASTIGATFAMLISRYFLKDWVQNRFMEEMRNINIGINNDGVFYLFTLRLLPIVPFFIVNFLMGLTSVRVSTFFWVSQLGMLPATLVYINAGSKLSDINSYSDIYSPSFILSFIILGTFPLLLKKILKIINDIRN